MSTYDPSGPEPEEGGKPSFDKNPPPAGGTPSGAPSDPYGTPTPPPGDPYGTPPPAGSPYDRPGAYGGTYGGGPSDQPPPGQGYGTGYGPGGQGSPGAGPVPGMPPLGSWPNRILARVIDYLLVQIVAILLVLPFASLGNRSGSTGAFWLACILWFFYEGLMLSRDGQTLGKKAMKVRVAMLVDGNIPTKPAAWTRSAVFIVPAVICCAMLWWVIDGLFGVFDKPYRQCIHDKSAKTVVVSTV
ncbi:RDD family protein [Kitasatospora sp. NBC_00240]|uniref:RDD family protein n=1 Tax=Kitasatospora sp. NBC_00240 TaxID=2903567 RepID=UPI00224D1228|nr:RDD family protein [Kitasatospora sp. NBC_00240]MCX5212688.1 RDD family protein [Kitasatospora sp. NBC_00240]